MTIGEQSAPGHVDVVIGLQFGSEGKGAFCHYLAKSGHYQVSARTGGPQAGHTVRLDDGTEKAFHTLPVAAVVPDIALVIPPGAIVDPQTLHAEVEWCEGRGLEVRNRLHVDQMATVLLPKHREEEATRRLRERIGGTGIGVGAATADRVWREAPLARDEDSLADYLEDTLDRLHQSGPLLLETTQGYGLGLMTSTFYPQCTSREISTSQVLSDCGLPPRSLRNTFGVARTYPIRVGGDSGLLQDETTWVKLDRAPELTTSTKRERRIGGWEKEVVQRAAAVCDLDAVVLTFVDYLKADHSLDNETSWESVQQAVGTQLLEMQHDLGTPIRWVATGFGTIIEVPEGAIS